MTDKEKKGRGVHPLSDALTLFRVEIDPHRDGLAVTVSGAERILSFSETQVELYGCGRALTVYGDRLSVTVFGRFRTEISGRVEDIRFL